MKKCYFIFLIYFFHVGAFSFNHTIYIYISNKYYLKYNIYFYHDDLLNIYKYLRRNGMQIISSVDQFVFIIMESFPITTY